MLRFFQQKAFFVLSIILLTVPLHSTKAEQLSNDMVLIVNGDSKHLTLGSDVIKAIELAKIEAEKQKVNFNSISRYWISFEKKVLRVSLGPPYQGGLDGPEFTVDFRRTDLFVLHIRNTLDP